MKGKIVEILIAVSPDTNMDPVTEIRALAGKGLEGDRYCSGKGTFSNKIKDTGFQVTLVESEKIREFRKLTGLDFTSNDARRNLVTEGIDLNALVEQEFQIGEVRCRGIRLCEPCSYLAEQTHREILTSLLHKGGLRAEILQTGMIRVGDSLEVLD